MIVSYFTYCIPALLLLGGCNDTRPVCDSIDTRDAVTKVVAGNSNNALAIYVAKHSAGVQGKLASATTEAEKQEILDKARQAISYRLGDEIATNSRSTDKRILTCRGTLSANLEDATATKAVDFKVEQKSDGDMAVSVSPFQFDPNS
jgi:hypothetical protein